MKRAKSDAIDATQGRAEPRPRSERKTSGTVPRVEVDPAQRVDRGEAELRRQNEALRAALDEAEAALARVETALREKDRRKDEFLVVLSHELRSPLTPLRSSLAVLSRTNLTSEEARGAYAVMNRQVSHLGRLVDDLLDVTRIAKGSTQLRCEPVHLTSLVRHTVEDHRTTFTAAGIQVETRIDATPMWVHGDPARLVQVISNALGNAKKFTSPGGRVTVTLAAGDRGPDVEPTAVLRVRDTGVGIAPRELDGIFEPFTRRPQPISRARGGLGLGLAMVKGLVELHRGTVRIESEGLGRGAELTITLPLHAPTADGAPKEPRPTRCRRVLIIEDNVDAADTLKEVLMLGKHDVRVAYDGPAGLALAREFRPEIVICDIGLAEMDGYDVARAIRADAVLRSAYLVALSGYARLEDRRRAAVAGFNQHLAKPPSLDALDRVLEEAPPALDIN
jgi:two-component system, chemotaxis family, CheB/CheR fusion protein